MPTNFETALSFDSAAIVSVDGEFAETISFLPKNGTARTIYAVITRDPPEQMGADGNVRKIRAALLVQNHATAGALITEVEGATATFQTRKGDSTSSKAWPVHLSTGSNPVDAGMIRLEV